MSDIKILMVGSDQIFAIENFYSKYLEEDGITVDKFNSYTIFEEYYYSNILRKIIFKAGLSSIFKTINRQFRDAIEKYRPNVIWIFKGMEIYPDSLEWAKTQNIKLVNYNPDNPLIFSDKGSGNKFVTDSIPLYDLHLTYHLGVKRELEKRYHSRVEILPFAFENDESLYQQCLNQREVLKTCFLGNPDKRRAAFIEALAGRGVKVDVYGNNWNRFLGHSNINIFPPAYGVEQWKVLWRYRAQLNLMRIHNDDSHNMRTFEVPGIGGIMVAPDTAEHRMYFEDGKEAFFFKDINDCLVIINKLMNIDASESDVIRKAARDRSINSGYSYKARTRLAIGYIQSLFDS